MRIVKVTILSLLCAAFSMAGVATAQQQKTPAQRSASAQNSVAREVRHQLVMLPRYSVFDILEYSVDGGHVTLKGRRLHADAKIRCGRSGEERGRRGECGQSN